MGFDNLRPQPSIHARADAYGAECIARSRRAAEALPCRLDVPYGADERQRLDIYLPRTTGHDLPVLLFMHGGGWTHGYKEWSGFTAPAVVDLPAIYVAVSYRLFPDVAYPGPVKDCIAALKWVVDHLGEFGGSPNRLFVGGHSAGGHLAALMAVHPEWLTEAGLPADAIRGVFCLSGTLTRRMVNPAFAPDHVPPGEATDTAPDSPIALAGAARAPFLIAWGDKENERMARSGELMMEALARAKCPAEAMVLANSDHFDTHLNTDRADSPWTARVRAWMAGAAPRS
ncbi:MAG: alpha/beta hydrolase [Rhodospirillaceae bacterium]|nr:alpha/beta hydrolase [Rhodospirillaceae bacterium]